MSVRLRLAAWRELLLRYRFGFASAWRQRRLLTPRPLLADEAEFLPAALALQGRPVSPAGLWTARAMVVFVSGLVLWSVLGRIDIVVNASGKIIPSQRTKTIAAVEVASVRALHVVEGQAVRAGDVLVELDSRASDSERDKAMAEGEHARLQAARSRALLAAVGGAGPGEPALEPMVGVAAAHWRDAQRQLQAQWRDYVAKRQRLDGEIDRYAQALPLAAQRARDFSELAADGDVSRHAWMEKEQARIDLQGLLDEVRHQRAGLVAETRRLAEEALADASRRMAGNEQDEKRAAAHSEVLRLLAPVDGTVQQLALHTVGGVVPAAQPLMEIVPAQGMVEVEAYLENKDIGFVQEGQPAAVKIDAFEYTRYGTVMGRVSHVSRDAIQDEKRGLVYAVKVMLDRRSIDIDGREAMLAAGMAARVDIRTGERRVVEYVLAPLLQHGRESLHER